MRRRLLQALRITLMVDGSADREAGRILNIAEAAAMFAAGAPWALHSRARKSRVFHVVKAKHQAHAQPESILEACIRAFNLFIARPTVAQSVGQPSNGLFTSRLDLPIVVNVSIHGRKTNTSSSCRGDVDMVIGG